MNEVTIDVLLEFLYNQFATTFVFCAAGSFIRESITSMPKKNKKSKLMDTKRIVTSTMFSTFLMCACAEYIDLPFEVYAIVSVFCGMWGLVIVNLAMNVSIITKFASKIVKNITNPIVKSTVESITEVLDEQEKSSKKENKEPSENKDNSNETK